MQVHDSTTLFSQDSDTFAAAQVALAEREARDRGWWHVMSRCFSPESRVEFSWFQGSGADFVTASQKMRADGVSSRHRLGPPIVHRLDNRAVVVLPAAIELYPTGVRPGRP
ncbi:hypothetical protein ACLMAL_12640 [Nocardia sp. CWNU-33]|uniref:hypothetical protein n=1 Tax=Nocardia sp. CWNU-33 TaxID=3392117 RepID=UPI00398EF723